MKVRTLAGSSLDVMTAYTGMNGKFQSLERRTLSKSQAEQTMAVDKAAMPYPRSASFHVVR
jgi:hypothetical protein